MVGHLILMEQDFARAVERRRDDEAALAVVERGDAERRQHKRRGGFFFDGLEVLAGGEGAEDAVVVDEQGGVVCRLTRQRGGRRGWDVRFAAAFGAVRGQDGGAGGEFGLGGESALLVRAAAVDLAGRGGAGAG